MRGRLFIEAMSKGIIIKNDTGLLTRLFSPVVRRFHHRLLCPLPAVALPNLPFEWQVMRMRPGKMDVRSVTSALKVWCHFIEDTREIVGGIAELGVRAGDSLILAALWARRRGILKTFYGFDSFSGWPQASEKDAGDWNGRAVSAARFLAIRETVQVPYGWIPDHFFREVPLPAAEWVHRRIAQYGISRRVRLVEGWFKDTMPKFTETLSLIKNDSDLYESTLDGLTYLWPRLSPRGVFLNAVHVLHPGTRKALEEFFANRPERIQSLDLVNHPGMAFVVKRGSE